MINRKERLTNIVLALWAGLIGSLIVWQVVNHVMWRDEMQAWVLARDSHSIQEFLYNMGFEGVPPLWHLMLVGLQIFTDNPVSMQVLQTCLALLNLFLVWRYAPLPPLAKALVLASFPLAYQYAVFSRCYALGLAFVMASLIARDKKKPILSWFLLGMAGQSTLLETVLVCALALHRFLIAPPILKKEIKGVAVFAALILFALYMSVPTVERMGLQDLTLRGQMVTFFGSLYVAFGWPMALVTYVWVLRVALGMAVAVLVLCFDRDWRCLVAMASLVLVNLTIDQVGYPLVPHHLMLIPLGVVFFLWQKDKKLSKVALTAFLLLFVSSAKTGLDFATLQRSVPYSQSRAVATWIEDKGLRNEFWIAIPDYTGTPVCGYLGRQFYLPQSDTMGCAPHWAKKNKSIEDLEDLFIIARKALDKRNLTEGWLLLGHSWSGLPGGLTPIAGMTLSLTEVFPGAQVGDEQYMVFHLTRTP